MYIRNSVYMIIKESDPLLFDPFLIMGKQVSKQEEIIIAQNGANSASTSNLEVNVKLYGSIMLAVLILLGLLFLYFCAKKCKMASSSWMQHQIKTVHSEIPVVTVQQPQPQPQPQVVFAQRQ